MEKLKVLIVEDSGFFRRALAMNLTDRGFEVLTAVDGYEALNIAIDQRPNVVLLDMFMPKLNGMMLLRILRFQPETRSIPVILLSGSVQQADVAQARALGVVEYISKTSMDFEDLVYLVEREGQRQLLEQMKSQPFGNAASEVSGDPLSSMRFANTLPREVQESVTQ